MTNPLTLKAFAEWCESKPADEVYDWMSCEDCAISQYVREREASYIDVANLPTNEGRLEDTAYDEPRTFGALASRLRASP